MSGTTGSFLVYELEEHKTLAKNGIIFYLRGFFSFKSKHQNFIANTHQKFNNPGNIKVSKLSAFKRSQTFKRSQKIWAKNLKLYLQ